VSWETVLHDQRERDDRDAARAIAPMKPAADAQIIETTGSTIDQVVDRLVEDLQRHLQRSQAAGARATSGGSPRE
jgi:cytidylate kinase